MKEAFWIWTSLNVVALTVTLFMLLRPSTTGLSPPMGLTIAAMTILYDPVAMNFEYAQRQIVILLLLVVAIARWSAITIGRQASCSRRPVCCVLSLCS